MNNKEDDFVKLKIYRNKSNGQRTVYLPSKKIKKKESSLLIIPRKVFSEWFQ